ncbi:MAG: M48 family metallopeptidase [Anaerolineales bacterium]|nr:M48 family metallopeptidase [Anaerolineales bacterium]
MTSHQTFASQASHSSEHLHSMIDSWATEIGVSVTRVQIRKMKRKWGSVSTAGILTLSSHLLCLPLDLAEYVIVHELVHLRCPDHSKAWKVSMGLYLPDWRIRHSQLQKHRL